MRIEGKGGFGSRLREAFNNAKNVDIASKLGVTEAAVRNYIDGRIPSAEMLVAISERTNCSIHWLVTGEGPKHLVKRDLLPGEEPYGVDVVVGLPDGFIPILEKLAAEQNETVSDQIAEMVRATLADRGLIRTKLTPEEILHYVPLGNQPLNWVPMKVLGFITAGRPVQLYEPENIYIVMVPELMVEGTDCFLLDVKGDSMIGEGIFHGDRVMISPNATIFNGCTVAVEIDDAEAVLKKYYKFGSQITLRSANPAYEDMHYHASRIRMRGLVVGTLRGRTKR